MSKKDVSPKAKSMIYYQMQALYFNEIKLAIQSGMDESLAIKNILSIEQDRQLEEHVKNRNRAIFVFQEEEHRNFIKELFKEAKQDIQLSKHIYGLEGNIEGVPIEEALDALDEALDALETKPTEDLPIVRKVVMPQRKDLSISDIILIICGIGGALCLGGFIYKKITR